MIPIGGDQASYVLKQAVMKHLDIRKIPYVDLGCYDMEMTNYNIFADRVCRLMLKENLERGIVLCGSGLGIGMAANRYPGIRCGRCDSSIQVKMARRENDMNVLSMGGRIVGPETAADMVDAFLDTEFDEAYRNNVMQCEELDRRLYRQEFLNRIGSGAN
ncbi:RpiB/LacA/LacB family sugar-phosphate isomerase [Anaerolentibacter hominis]|uniref:RpiB/LacA/LacB family sugar-phosphate isomerase n=1 Tax=Anaerolentibacter hominis TaxID=3079009 RepID=UPI0031B81302